MCADAPWCGHCRQLEPDYAEAAGKLKAEESAIRLAKVDAVEEKELAEEFEIKGFPTLKLFMDGDRKHPVDFLGKCTRRSVVVRTPRSYYAITGPQADFTITAI